MSATSPPLTIGALSRATGVPVNTLRTWERRYGVPSGDRTEGGHRLYPTSTVEHVRLVVRALDVGHRPAQVLPASPDALRELLGATPAPVRVPAPLGMVEDGDQVCARWLAATRALDGQVLLRGFGEEAARLGLPLFLEERAIPFLRHVGEGWCSGELRVFHEHFASERLRAFLAGMWRPLADAAEGPPVVCATLPGDRHDLGLHMAAALLAVEGRRLVFLGADAPIADIADAATLSGANAVVLSVGPSTPDPEAGVAEVRARVPRGVPVYVGGAGAPEGVAGVTLVAEIPTLAGYFQR